MTDAWDPDTYRRFSDERRQPFLDLLQLIHPGRIETAVDLGCGSGELTRFAADELGCGSMLGIDDSPAMLARASEEARDDVVFCAGDIATWTGDGQDLLIANASLQWVPDHAAVLARWTAALRAGGQLAVQVPANATAPSHTIAAEVANTEPFLTAFGAAGPPPDPVADNVCAPEQYSTLLHDLGYEHQHVRLQVYPHILPSSRSVVEWVRGTTLTRFRRRLTDELYTQFLATYEQRLLEAIGDHSPHFFPFRRILMWGRRAV